MLAKLLSQYWWVLLLRGLLAVAFGIALYAWPDVSLATMVLLFAALAIVEGASDIVSAFFTRKEHEHWWWLVLQGVISVLFGVVALQSPALTTVVLLLYIGAYAIVTGALRVVLAVRLRAEHLGDYWLGLTGLASILFGVLMIARPAAGALALLALIATWSIAIGTLLVILAFRLRALRPKGTTSRAGRTGRPLAAHG